MFASGLIIPFLLTGGLAQQIWLSALGQGKEVSPGTQDLKSSSSLFQAADTARLTDCSLFTYVVHREGWQLSASLHFSPLL